MRKMSHFRSWYPARFHYVFADPWAAAPCLYNIHSFLRSHFEKYSVSSPFCFSFLIQNHSRGLTSIKKRNKCQQHLRFCDAVAEQSLTVWLQFIHQSNLNCVSLTVWYVDKTFLSSKESALSNNVLFFFFTLKWTNLVRGILYSVVLWKILLVIWLSVRIFVVPRSRDENKLVSFYPLSVSFEQVYYAFTEKPDKVFWAKLTERTFWLCAESTGTLGDLRKWVCSSSKDFKGFLLSRILNYEGTDPVFVQ